MPSSNRCQACGAQSRPSAKFCRSCGAALPAELAQPIDAVRRCPSCGAETPVGATFCVSCGASLTEPAETAGRGGDRRGLWLGGGIAAVLAVVVVIVVVLAGGGGGDADGLTGKQRRALEQLREASTVSVQVRVEDGVPRTLGARVPIPASVGDDPEDKARFFLDTYRDLYGLDEPDDALFLAEVLDAPDDKEVVSFQQRAGEFEVFGSDVRVHINSDNEVTYVSATLPSDEIDVPVEPVVDTAEASIVAIEALGLGAEAEVEVLGSQVLVLNEGLITGERTESVLAVRIDLAVADPLAVPVSFVDATTGKLILSYDDLQADRDRKTYTANNSSYFFATSYIYSELRITEAGPVEGTDPPDREMRLGHQYAGRVYDYYSDTHGRDNYDNAGGPLYTYVHFDTTRDNAFWYDGAMWFMDGLVTLDIFGHEFTHGVIRNSAGLVYANQSGALNESFADVFGVIFIERGNDWLMGEGALRQVGTRLERRAFRSLQNPPSIRNQPHHMDQFLSTTLDRDHGGVHTNSGIPNYAAYLIVQGGTHSSSGISVNGIGRGKAERIYYKALTEYLTSTSTFDDAKDALLRSCLDLLVTTIDIDFADCSSVINGYAAVGIGEPDADGDAVVDRPFDNCIGDFNPLQEDSNGDGIGDACEPATVVPPAATPTSAAAPTPTVVPGPGAGATPTATVDGGAPTPTVESAAPTPDLSWIEGVVQDTIAVLVGGDIPQEVAEVIGDDLRDCLTAAARRGASRSEAIGECQTFFEPPTTGETIQASGSFDAPFDRGNQISLSFPSDGGAVTGTFTAAIYFPICTGEKDFFCNKGEICTLVFGFSGPLEGSFDGVSALSGTATATTTETIERGCEDGVAVPETTVVSWSAAYNGERVRGRIASLEGDEPLVFTAFVVSP